MCRVLLPNKPLRLRLRRPRRKGPNGHKYYEYERVAQSNFALPEDPPKTQIGAEWNENPLRPALPQHLGNELLEGLRQHRNRILVRLPLACRVRGLPR